MEEGDDLLMAMAGELVAEQRIGETADQVWAKLRKEQGEALGVGGALTSECDGEGEPPTETATEVLVPPPAPMPEVVNQLLMFGTSLGEAVRRSRAPRHNRGCGHNDFRAVGPFRGMRKEVSELWPTRAFSSRPCRTMA